MHENIDHPVSLVFIQKSGILYPMVDVAVYDSIKTRPMKINE